MLEHALRPERIRQDIPNHIHIRAIDCFHTIPSTNTHLNTLPPLPLHHMHCAIATHQSKGQGRRQRTWVSEAGHGLLTSIAITLPKETPLLPRLSLITATIIIQALRSLGFSAPIGIKWPNDLYIDYKKLGGILIETEPCAEGHYLIIGIGINLKDQDHMDVANLSDHWPEMPDIHAITAALITHLYQLTQPDLALRHFTTTWPTVDLTLQHPIMISTHDRFWPDIGLGINDRGQLCTQQGHKLDAHTHSIRLIDQDQNDHKSDT